MLVKRTAAGVAGQFKDMPKMTDISERLVVHRPEHEAARRLAAFAAERRNVDGSLNIALRLPSKLPALWKLPFERRSATLYSLTSAGDPHPTYSVSWSSKDGGPLPEFAGALAVERVALGDCFGLILCGHYQPPFGRLGALFHRAFGRRITHRSARDLLRTIADCVEHASLEPRPERRRPREAAAGLH
jgi:hypothetical protein